MSQRSARFLPVRSVTLLDAEPTETFRGSAVVTEFPGAAGLLLWKALQDATCYVQASPDARPALFPSGFSERRKRELADTDLDHELRSALDQIGSLAAGPPEEAEPRAGRACERVAAWAEARGGRQTAAAFLEVAALLLGSSALAYEAGRRARASGRPARADGWFRKAIQLGREHDWEHYTLAHLALANSHTRGGNLPAARAFATRAQKAAGRHRLHHLKGLAAHELLIVAAKQGAEVEALELAGRALREYGATHPRILALAHDVAAFWLDSARFARSVAVFEAMLPRITNPVEHACVLANMVLAAAGAGYRERYERYWISTVQLVLTVPNRATAAEIWLVLAEAAAMLGEWEHAGAAAGQAADLAATGEFPGVRERAEAAAAAVASRRAALRREATDEPPAVAHRAEHLAGTLIQVLKTAPAPVP